ncbi:MAG: hypothetical protein PHE78_03520 [Candidatus Gastranaerophilales bacterium]|nr:hypothetical protein [Candidatus Gastranaerophilales bacterium]
MVNSVFLGNPNNSMRGISATKKSSLTLNAHQTTPQNQVSVYKTKGLVGNFYGAKINKSSVSFSGYHGDWNPAKKLFWVVSGKSSVYEDEWTKMKLFQGSNGAGWKKWVFAHPAELLKRTPEQAIQSIATLTKKENAYPEIPNGIFSPNFGEKWGRFATYIEVNPRALSTQNSDKSTEGLLNTIKILPAIPASQKNGANCVVLSSLYPSIHGDGYSNVRESSLYTVNLYSGISKNLTSDWLERDGQKMGHEEQVKAFNDLAHLRGLKTGFRMPLSEGQIKVQGSGFSWANKHDEEAYINSCVDAVDMGFDAIYFDSAKHCGGYDIGNYYGCGAIPDYQKMQYITDQIRRRTGRNDLSFVGEKCNDHIDHFKGLGLTAGTDWGKADDFNSVKWESKKQAHSREYAAGPEVSNDNDQGSIPYEQRLNRLKSCLFGYENEHDKLPCYMQMHDLFPLNWSTNTHDLMLNSRSFSAYGDPVSHWNNLFDGSNSANWYREEVNKVFAAAA